jgi:hypothetical protein
MRLGAAAVLGAVFLIGAAKAETVIFAPGDLGAWAKLSDDAVTAGVNQIRARCTWEVNRMVILSGGIPPGDRERLYSSCVSAAGLVVYSPQQFRAAADAWKAKNPGRKARGVAVDQ